MGMNKIPTLVIGLGGIGCRIAAGVNKLLDEEDKDYVGIVGIDTNLNDINNMREQGLNTIRISDERTVYDYLQSYPEFRKWFPIHSFLVQRGLSAGAGQIRALSRLAALAAQERNLFAPIESEINRIRTFRPGGNNHSIAVVICGSITGGTGAGMFLQIPLYVRKLLNNMAGLKNITIRGLFFGPDITKPHQTSEINRDAVSINAYACLKELNAFNLTQKDSDLAERIDLDFYKTDGRGANKVVWKIKTEQDAADANILEKTAAVIPYNYVYLLESNSAQGGLGNVDVSTVEALASRILYTLLFTPVINNALSVEDNFTASSIEKNGMNRFASAGICSLVFPSEIAKEYVTLSTARDIVKKEWTIIDKKCADIIADAQARRRTDGTVVIPSEADNYCDMFLAEVAGEDGTLGQLYAEAVYKTPEHEVFTIGRRFFGKIKDQVDAITNSEEVKNCKEACKVNTTNMQKFETAVSEITNIEIALEQYEKLVKSLVRTKAAAIANEMFPASWESMSSRINSENCIYSWITKVHPVTARFLCYDVIRLLRKKIKECQDELVDGINLSEYRENDFDTTTTEKDSAMQVVQNIKEKQNAFSKILSLDSGKLKKFTGIFTNSANKQMKNIDEWLEKSLYLAICNTLLKRFMVLSENYKVFFETLDVAIQDNDNRIKALENYTAPLGQLGIYCSSAAFRRMAAEYKAKNEEAVPGDVKVEVFKKIYGVVAADLASESSFDTTEQQRRLRKEANKKVLSGIFKDAILNPLLTNVERHGDGIVTLTAKQALVKEYEMKSGIEASSAISPEDFAEEVMKYSRTRVAEAMEMAAPLMAIDESAISRRAELVFFAIHPDNAEQSSGEPNKGLTLEKYFPIINESVDNQRPTILMERSFDPSAIICLKTEYLLEIDDLIKYRDTSENAKIYKKRIANIGGEIYDMFDEDAVKTVITPHLDRNWHEEAFIPDLTDKERKISAENKLKAFIYAMGRDYAVVYEDDGVSYDENVKIWHDITTGNPMPVRVCGNCVGGRYIDYFNALDYNRNMKKRILEAAEAYFKKQKGNLSSEEIFERVMEDDFVRDLIQPASKTEEGDMNIYDIFLSMRVYMKDEKYKDLFEGLIYALWESMGILFDRNARLVNKATIQILNDIYANSTVGKKLAAGEELNIGEQKLRGLHETLLEQRYH